MKEILSIFQNVFTSLKNHIYSTLSIPFATLVWLTYRFYIDYEIVTAFSHFVYTVLILLNLYFFWTYYSIYKMAKELESSNEKLIKDSEKYVLLDNNVANNLIKAHFSMMSESIKRNYDTTNIKEPSTLFTEELENKSTEELKKLLNTYLDENNFVKVDMVRQILEKRNEL